MHKALGSITRTELHADPMSELKRDLHGPESPLVTGMGQLGDISSFGPWRVLRQVEKEHSPGWMGQSRVGLGSRWSQASWVLPVDKAEFQELEMVRD